jgi:hypothetical protein
VVRAASWPVSVERTSWSVSTLQEQTIIAAKSGRALVADETIYGGRKPISIKKGLF